MRSKSNLWYLDNGCSRHIMNNKFLSLTLEDNCQVTFEDNLKGKVIGKRRVCKYSNSYIDSVLLVKGLKHNLLSFNQFCDKGSKVTLDSIYCIVEN